MLAPKRFVLCALLFASCKRSPMGKVADIRDELAGDQPQWDSALPACNTRATCAHDIAAAIGAPFDEKKPDQVSAATVAVMVARDRHGSDVTSPDVWLASISTAKGPGADALRLAVALEMSRVASKHAHAIDADSDARAFLADVAAIPGACKTYESLGAGADPDTMPPHESPDHSACVQHDLTRKDGPGATYGQGVFRAVAGGLALWKAELGALHQGAALVQGRSRSVLEHRLQALDEATTKIVPKTVAAPAGNVWVQTQDEHRAPLGGDAGRP
jgi:hypothetical protein